MKARPIFIAALSVALALAYLGGAAAQDAEPGVFADIIDVRVVNLEVVVTDRDGNRVRGLTREDFRLLVDGQEVDIDYFNEIAAGVAIESDQVAVPALTPGELVGTSFLVFIDELFALKHDRDRVLSGLRDQLGHLGPQDRMAVVAYDGKQLEMLSSWSQSQAALERTLKEAERRPAYGLHRVAELRSLDHDRRLGLRRLGREEGLGRMTTEERFHAERLEGQVRRSVSAASATLRAFAAPPGRKVMLVLSGGWPNRPADFVVADLDRPVLGEERSWGEELYRPLTETANLLGYTLYTVDVPGLRHQTAVAADESGPRAAGAGMAREMELRYTLEYLAQRTGGRPFLSGARTTALEEAVLDTRSYYWLGFTADRQGDDRRSTIKVEVLRPGLRVRHRESFQDFSRQAEVTMAVESGLLFGNPPSSQSLEVGVGEIRSSRRAMEVPLEIKIPLDAVTVLPAGDRYSAQLELRVGVRDDQGETVPVPVIPVDLWMDEEPEAGGHVTYQTELRLRATRHDVVVALYDPLSGALLSAAFQVAP